MKTSKKCPKCGADLTKIHIKEHRLISRCYYIEYNKQTKRFDYSTIEKEKPESINFHCSDCDAILEDGKDFNLWL